MKTFTAMVVYCERVAACDNIIVYKTNRHGINAATDTRVYSLPRAVAKSIIFFHLLKFIYHDKNTHARLRVVEYSQSSSGPLPPQRLGSGVDLRNRIVPSHINILLFHYNSKNSVEIKRFSSRTHHCSAEVPILLHRRRTLPPPPHYPPP